MLTVLIVFYLLHIYHMCIICCSLSIGQPSSRSMSAQMITVQERGNSIYRDSTYSGNLSMFGRQSLNRGLGLFGRNSFGRGTETFKRYQHAQQKAATLNNQQEEKQPQQSSRSSSEPLELQPLQHQSSPPADLQHEQMMTDQVEVQQIPVDDNAD